MAVGGYDFTTRGVDFQQPIQNFLGVRQMRQKNALMKQEQERFSKEEKIKVQKSISEIIKDELSAVEYDENYIPIPASLESAKQRAYIRVKEIAPNQADMIFQKLDQVPPDQMGKGILESRAAKEGEKLKETAAGKGSETERAWKRYNKNNPDKPVDFETYKNEIYNTPKEDKETTPYTTTAKIKRDLKNGNITAEEAADLLKKEAEQKQEGEYTKQQQIDDTRGYYQVLMKTMLDEDGYVKEGQEAAYAELTKKLTDDMQRIDKGKKPVWLNPSGTLPEPEMQAPHEKNYVTVVNPNTGEEETWDVVTQKRVK